MHLLPISKLPGNRLTYVAFALVLALSAVSARPTRGVVRDVPLIVCELCPLLAAAAFPADGDISSEVAVLDGVEDMCDPKKKPGRWLRSLDLVEKRKRLRVQKVDGVAACEVECRTAALACTDIVDKAGATDIADLIYSGASKEKVAKWLCAGSDGGASRACKGRAPYIWKGRPEGPAFSPISEKDLQMEVRPIFTPPAAQYSQGPSGTLSPHLPVLPVLFLFLCEWI